MESNGNGGTEIARAAENFETWAYMCKSVAVCIYMLSPFMCTYLLCIYEYFLCMGLYTGKVLMLRYNILPSMRVCCFGYVRICFICICFCVSGVCVDFDIHVIHRLCVYGFPVFIQFNR